MASFLLCPFYTTSWRKKTLGWATPSTVPLVKAIHFGNAAHLTFIYLLKRAARVSTYDCGMGPSIGWPLSLINSSIASQNIFESWDGFFQNNVHISSQQSGAAIRRNATQVDRIEESAYRFHFVCVLLCVQAETGTKVII